MNLCAAFTVLPTPLLLAIFTNPLLYHVDAQQQPQQPLYSIASFDSSSNFALDDACSSIYRRSIPSCQPFDFSRANQCSTLCTQSLQSIQDEAQTACESQGGIPPESLLAFFRNGTGVAQLCSVEKGGVSSTLLPQASRVDGGNGASRTIPPGAGGVSTATEVAADTSKATSMDLGNTGVIAVIIVVVVGSLLLLLASFFYYKKYYSKPSKG